MLVDAMLVALMDCKRGELTAEQMAHMRVCKKAPHLVEPKVNQWAAWREAAWACSKAVHWAVSSAALLVTYLVGCWVDKMGSEMAHSSVEQSGCVWEHLLAVLKGVLRADRMAFQRAEPRD